MQTDEQGKPVHLDLAMLSKNLRDDVLPITQDDSHSEHDIIPTPKQIFEQASRYILHQPHALRELSTVFFYHLTNQRDRQAQKLINLKATSKNSLMNFAKPLVLVMTFLKC